MDTKEKALWDERSNMKNQGIQELISNNLPDAFIRAVFDDKASLLPLSCALCRHDLEVTQDSDIIGHFSSISDCKYAMSEEYNICPFLGKNINIS